MQDIKSFPKTSDQRETHEAYFTLSIAFKIVHRNIKQCSQTRWSSIYDAGPTLHLQQHFVNVSCLLWFWSDYSKTPFIYFHFMLYSVTFIPSKRIVLDKTFNFHYINPLTAKLFNLNFHPLEVVSRWRDTQLQVSENYSDLTKLRSTVF